MDTTTSTTSTTPTTTHPTDPVLLELDEVVTTADDRRLTVTAKALACLPRVRARLLALARDGDSTTYGALVRDLDLPYPAVGIGRLLDLLAADCARRDEPGLDALVHGASRRDAAAIEIIHRHWGGASRGLRSV